MFSYLSPGLSYQLKVILTTFSYECLFKKQCCGAETATYWWSRLRALLVEPAPHPISGAGSAGMKLNTVCDSFQKYHKLKESITFLSHNYHKIDPRRPNASIINLPSVRFENVY
jgi:hypothetical protein